MNELAGGYVQLGINAVPSVAAQIKAGKLVPLAVASAKRSRAFPEVPTMAEAGLKNFEYDIWYALFAPRARRRIGCRTSARCSAQR